VVQGLEWKVSPTPAIQWKRAKTLRSNGSNSNKRIGNKERTSFCHTSVLNVGNATRLIGFESTDNDKDRKDATTTLPDRDPWKFLLSLMFKAAVWSSNGGNSSLLLLLGNSFNYSFLLAGAFLSEEDERC
jgi:hypothetical protein